MKTKLLLVVPLIASCVGTTGSGLVDFSAFASGPSGIHPAFELDSTLTGYSITLDQATMHIGAVYLDSSPCSGGSEYTSCINPAGAVAQVTGSVDLNVLSPDPQPFSVGGTGIIQQALSGEIWLTGGDVNIAQDDTAIVCVAGTATKNGATYPFVGQVTISASNRAIPDSDPAQPGLSPICKERIVAPICLSPAVEPVAGASLHLEVKPMNWFNNVDFSQLALAPYPYYTSPTSLYCDFGTVTGARYVIPDARTGALAPVGADAGPSGGLNGNDFFQSIESSYGVYSFAFETP